MRNIAGNRLQTQVAIVGAGPVGLTVACLQISLRCPGNELIVKSRLADFRSGKAMPGLQYIIDSDTFDLYNDMNDKHFYLLFFGDKEAFTGICEKIGDDLPILFLNKSQLSLLNKKLSWPTRGLL